MTQSLLRLLVIAAAIVGLDQWTKDWASRALAGRPPVEVIGELVQLTFTRNSGVAFGLGAGVKFPYYIFSIAAVAAILWLFLSRRVHGFARQLALALVMGGAVGNLIDRLATGEVVDFILLSWRQWQFPVFNVADSAVTIGVVLFALARSPHDAPSIAKLPADDPAGVGRDPAAS
ncbi:MAG: signal peptidase II [Candidatus Eisenbacteria bacterium]|uniref:Lipoprotein signal peptidase n=1 Tax=Eiseniibacteriota bacterium TaxID=2212470 RepID=A0A849SRQ8_UNCEI|nr:signal peptidase II [Candidatus Eisenbacteria bacterium]